MLLCAKFVDVRCLSVAVNVNVDAVVWRWLLMLLSAGWSVGWLVGECCCLRGLLVLFVVCKCMLLLMVCVDDVAC